MEKEKIVGDDIPIVAVPNDYLEALILDVAIKDSIASINAENARLRAVVEFYARNTDNGELAKSALEGK